MAGGFLSGLFGDDSTNSGNVANAAAASSDGKRNINWNKGATSNE